MKIRLNFLLSLLCIFSISTVSADKLNDIKESGKINVGISYDNEPFSFLNRSKKLIGFDVDLVKLIAKDLDVKVVFKEVTSKKQIINALIGGRLDLVTSFLHNTKSEKYIDFSISYFYDGQSILAKSNVEKYSYKDYETGKIGHIENSISGKIFEVIQPTVELKTYKDYDSMNKAVISGEIDAATASYSVLSLYEKRSNGKLITIGKPFTLEPIAFAISENESNLRDMLNLRIQKLVKDGEYDKLYKEWFKQAPTKKPILWP